MATVRPYDASDRDRVRELCLENTGTLVGAEDTKAYTLLTKCDYYLENEPDNCFVAVDETDGVIGCILCAENTDRFEKTFQEVYVPKAAAISARRYVDAKLSLLPVTMYRQFYQAHFVMFVNSSWYGLDVGSDLIAALRKSLKSKRITHVMTICDPTNEDDSKLLENCGFKVLLCTRFGTTYGLEIKD